MKDTSDRPVTVFRANQDEWAIKHVMTEKELSLLHSASEEMRDVLRQEMLDETFTDEDRELYERRIVEYDMLAKRITYLLRVVHKVADLS